MQRCHNGSDFGQTRYPCDGAEMMDLWFWLWLPVLVGITAIEVIGGRHGQLADRTLRWPANLGLFGLEIATTSALSAGLVFLAVVQAPADPILVNLRLMPLALEVPLFMVAITFVTYWLHRVSHGFALLWRFHRIHHSDTIVDPTTSLRHHPGEVVISFAVYQLLILMVHPSPEAVAVATSTERCFAAATHTSLTLPNWLDRWLGLIFVTPLQHAVHHSDFQPETDTNYGTVLNIWDRVFGTFRARPLRGPSDFRQGLTEVPAAKAEDLAVLLALPMMARDPWAKKRASGGDI